MPITITFSTAGSFTIEDDGTVGNATSIVRRDSDGAILAVIPHPADSLVFRAIVPGVNLTFNVTDSLGAAALIVGSLVNAAESPDSIVVKNFQSSGAVTLVSNGSITEGGSDAAADISATSIILSAASGVGTPGNAIETQTGLLEAETTTGGISIANVGNLQVGGFSADVDGLDVVTSGDILLTNLGSITLSDETSFDSVHGGETSGNVTLIANGFDSDITSNVDQSAIIAPRGGVTLTAGRDVSFGLGGVDFGNDVRANGSIVVNAGRDFLLSGFADFFADGVLGTTGGNLIVNAGRHISLLDDTGNSASLAVLGSGGGDVILTTGAGGLLTLEPPSTNTLSSGSGSVIVNADRIIIGATSGITASGDVTLRPVSEGRAIVLGSLSDSGAAIELSDGELDRIFADTLTLGSSSTGPITVGAPIAPASVQNFTLRSGTDIFANFSLTAPDTLSLFAGDNIYQLGASVFTATTLNATVDVVDGDDGAGGVAVLLGTVTATNALLNGSNQADSISGSGADEKIFGFGGADALTGGAGNDELNGGAGADVMDGGLGDDTFVVDSGGDLVVEAPGEGLDTVLSSITHTLSDNVENLVLTGLAGVNGTGNALDNEITGNDGNNVLNGGTGADTMRGLLGDDTYFVDAVGDIAIEDDPAGGTDLVLSSVSFTLGANVDNLTLTAAGGAIDGTGNSQANIIIGNNSANLLNGGGGADTMNGAGGNDTYVVDDAGDLLTEASSAGTDLVLSSVTFTLGANVENLTLTGALKIKGTGNALDNVITGNSVANVLIGGDGNDQLDGGGGPDKMSGGTGDDTYIVNNVGDTVTEGGAAGLDTVISSVTFSLSGNVENLILSGVGAINGIGNSVANSMNGNSAVNILNGGGGDDIMAGGNGDDVYIVAQVGDQVIEMVGEGTDLVKSTVSYTLGANVEKLTLRGSASIDGTGNDLANIINGNGGANLIDGGTGADKMFGADGNDTYIVDNVADQVTEASSGGGIDLVRSSISFTLGENVENLTLTGNAATNGTGNAGANTLTGNAGANVLDGGKGNDILIGGGGADTLIGGLGNDALQGDNGNDDYVFNKPLGATNVDHIVQFVGGGADTIVLENAIFTGIALGALNANALRVGAAAADADDRIVYDPATGNLFFDSDGVGGVAQILFAVLDNQPASLVTGDFLVT